MAELVADASHPITAADDPKVRALTLEDISGALADGMRDFRAAPGFGLLVGAVYTLGGNLLLAIFASLDMLYLAYPMAAGFALVAPFAAIGVYETSRRLANGEGTSISELIGAVPPHARREIAYMALVTAFGLIVWIYAAGFLYALFFGMRPLDYGDIVTTAVSTPRGIAFLMAGNVLGAIIATIIFSVSAVSYPFLLDQDRDFVTAMITSIRVVLASPMVLMSWGIYVATLLVIAMLPMFLGLVVVLPWLGHASWHLYKRAVET